MMKVGDPKKAGVLALVAVLIICVAVVQVLPKTDGKPAREAPKESAEAIALDGRDPMPVGPIMERLKADPFAHAKLKGTTGAAEQADREGDKTAKSRPPTLQGDLAGSEDWREFGPRGTIPPVDPTSGAPILPATPDQSGVPNQTLKPEPKRTILVEAVISIDNPRAFIKLGQLEAMPFNVGSKLGAFGTITKITEAGVTVRFKNGIRVLPVGSEVTL